MSSSFLSTQCLLQLLPYSFTNARVGSRLHGQVPCLIAGEAFAFYRIFLGHDHRQIVRKADVVRRVTVMVGKRMLDDPQAQTPQMRKEPVRIADAGHGMDGRAPERTSGGPGPPA